MNKYYYLPIDSYYQPTGIIKEIYCTEQEYEVRKRDIFGAYYYIYKTYKEAYIRSMA